MTNQQAAITNLQSSDEIFLSVVIPAYNESSRLPDSLQKVLDYLATRDYSYEVLVVDDGSSDNTADLAEEFIKQSAGSGASPSFIPHNSGNPQSAIRVIRNPHRGKGYAVRTGMLAAQGRYILYSDADFSAPIEEVEKLLRYLQGKYDIAIGSREGKGAVRIDEPFYRHLMGRVFNTFVRLVALPQFNDTQCGFKAFRKEAAYTLFRSLHLYGDNTPDVQGALVTGFDVEVLYLALKWGYKIKEVPVRWFYSKGANVNPIKDSYRMLKDIAKVRMNGLRGVYSKRRPTTDHRRPTTVEGRMADLTPDTFKMISWQSPWRYVGIGEGGGYERELMHEAAPGHPLHNARAIAVGVRVDQDDVLFLLPDLPKPLAVVHLTYSSASDEDPDSAARVPHTTFYSSLDDWLTRGMAADHAAHVSGSPSADEE